MSDQRYFDFLELKVGDRVKYYTSLKDDPGEGSIISLINIHTIILEVGGKLRNWCMDRSCFHYDGGVFR